MEEAANPNREPVNEPPQPEAMLAGNHNEAPQPEAMPAGNHNVEPQQDPILIVVVLVMTLTYQGLASPSSTILKEGSSKIDWGCIFAQNDSHDVLKSFEECPAIFAFLFLVFNTMIFLLSIFIGYTTLRGPNLVPVRLIMVLLVLCYGVLLTAFYINTACFALFCGAAALVVIYISHLQGEFMR